MPAERAGRGLSFERELFARIARHDADGAADGVTSEQSALRAFEDFDARDVEEIDVRADRASEINAVQIDAHAGIEVEREVVLADAADRGREHRGVAGERRAAVEVDVRGQVA